MFQQLKWLKSWSSGQLYKTLVFVLRTTETLTGLTGLRVDSEQHSGTLTVCSGSNWTHTESKMGINWFPWEVWTHVIMFRQFENNTELNGNSEQFLTQSRFCVDSLQVSKYWYCTTVLMWTSNCTCVNRHVILLETHSCSTFSSSWSWALCSCWRGSSHWAAQSEQPRRPPYRSRTGPLWTLQTHRRYTR